MKFLRKIKKLIKNKGALALKIILIVTIIASTLIPAIIAISNLSK